MQNRGKVKHLEHENDLKPHFGPFLAIIGPILGPTKMIPHIDHHYLLDIIPLNQKIQNRHKLMHFEQGNGLKPHFGPF